MQLLKFQKPVQTETNDYIDCGDYVGSLHFQRQHQHQNLGGREGAPHGKKKWGGQKSNKCMHKAHKIFHFDAEIAKFNLVNFPCLKLFLVSKLGGGGKKIL